MLRRAAVTLIGSLLAGGLSLGAPAAVSALQPGIETVVVVGTPEIAREEVAEALRGIAVRLAANRPDVAAALARRGAVVVLRPAAGDLDSGAGVPPAMRGACAPSAVGCTLVCGRGPALVLVGSDGGCREGACAPGGLPRDAGVRPPGARPTPRTGPRAVAVHEMAHVIHLGVLGPAERDIVRDAWRRALAARSPEPPAVAADPSEMFADRVVRWMGIGAPVSRADPMAAILAGLLGPPGQGLSMR